tara:strand:+ start:1627 stop:2037 length:411 start_codon:yes stop_codon:yes gene_type:complete
MKGPVNVAIDKTSPDPIDRDYSGLPCPIVTIDKDDYTWRQISERIKGFRRNNQSLVAEPLAVVVSDRYFEGLDDSYHNVNEKGANYCIDRWACEVGATVKPVVTEYTFQVPKGEYPIYVLEACLWLRDHYTFNPSL